MDASGDECEGVGDHGQSKFGYEMGFKSLPELAGEEVVSWLDYC